MKVDFHLNNKSQLEENSIITNIKNISTIYGDQIQSLIEQLNLIGEEVKHILQTTEEDILITNKIFLIP